MTGKYINDKRIAIIGAGPAGAIALEAFLEYGFKNIQVFERRNLPGGTWVQDHQLDSPSPNPDVTIYPGLETNILPELMSFSTKPIERPGLDTAYTAKAREKFGTDKAFVPVETIFDYVRGFFSGDRQKLVRYNASVDKIEQVNGPGSKWNITVNGEPPLEFDYVYVAVGRFHTPFVPQIPGTGPITTSGTFTHSVLYRNPEDFSGKRVLLIGGSISSADIVFLIKDVAESIYLSINGVLEIVVEAFSQPFVKAKGVVDRFEPGTKDQTIKAIFKDGSSVDNIDKIIFSTGYTLELPFLDEYTSKYGGILSNNSLKNFYLTTWWNEDPSLVVAGYITDGLTLRGMEYQARATAQLWSSSNDNSFPSRELRDQWEISRRKRNLKDWHSWYPNDNQFFDEVVKVGWAENDKDRLPNFNSSWRDLYNAGFALKNHFWKQEREKWLNADPKSAETLLDTTKYIKSRVSPFLGEDESASFTFDL